MKKIVKRKRKDQIVIECTKCHHKWIPNPNMWRNTFAIYEGRTKIIHCPACGNRMGIKNKALKEILELNYIADGSRTHK